VLLLIQQFRAMVDGLGANPIVVPRQRIRFCQERIGISIIEFRTTGSNAYGSYKY